MGAAHQAPLFMGTLQARILEWVARRSSRGSSQPRDRTQVFHIGGRFSTVWANGETQNCGFDLHFSDDYWYEHLFMYLLNSWISSLEIVYSSLLPICQLDCLWFLVLSCNSITYFGYHYLMRCVLGKYFLPCHMMSFYFWLFFLLCRSFLAWGSPTCLFSILLLVL